MERGNRPAAPAAQKDAAPGVFLIISQAAVGARVDDVNKYSIYSLYIQSKDCKMTKETAKIGPVL